MDAWPISVLAIINWLLFSRGDGLRPGRKGIFAAFAYPVGWAAGELPAQAIVVEGALLGLLWWWGWPRTHSLSVTILAVAILVLQ